MPFLGDEAPHLYYEVHCNDCDYAFFWKTWRQYDPDRPDKDLTTLSPDEQLAKDPGALDA